MDLSPSQPPAAVLELRDVCKQFSGVRALDKVDFSLQGGEVHALLGENGAGKSTLVKVMTGAYALDSGSMTLDGRPLVLRTPADAQAAGISTVYQEVNLLPNLSVAHNLYLGREPRRYGCIQWRRLYRDARQLLQRLQLDIDVTRSLGTCSLAVQQLVAIARGVDLSARVLVLDEPTASLDQGEVELLFGLLDKLREGGMAIVFISHFLDQVYRIADRITVLRNGQRIGTFATAELPRRELVAHMLGRELEVLEAKPARDGTQTTADTVLETRALAARNGIKALSFSAARGEVVGLSGLLGSGRTEVCEALFGLTQVTAGSVVLHGQTLRIRSPRMAIRQALALCPEDRKEEGILAELGIRENIMLALQARRGWLRPLRLREQQRIAEEAVKALRIACPHIEKNVGELSGGNQQKVILARWLATQPEVLILDEPTRGIDIGAHAEVIRLIRELCAQGKTVIVASSEIEELVAVCDQVVVMRERRMHATLHAAQVDESRIMAAIADSKHKEYA